MSRNFEALWQTPETARIARLIEEQPPLAEEAVIASVARAYAAEPFDTDGDRRGGPARPIPINEQGKAGERAAFGLNEAWIFADEVEAAIDSGMEDGGYAEVEAHPLPRVPVFPFLAGGDAHAAEQYRILRTNILQHPAQPKVIAISSAAPGDGKTLTSINIAGILAMKSDSRVLLIDADLRRCAVASTLGIETGMGFGDLLKGTCKLKDAVVKLRSPENLYVLPAGQVSVTPPSFWIRSYAGPPWWKSAGNFHLSLSTRLLRRL